jgi:hypothetical protein
VPRHQWQLLRRQYPAAQGQLESALDLPQDLRTGLTAAMTTDPAGPLEQDRLAAGALTCVQVLRRVWARLSLEDAFRGETGDGPRPGNPPPRTAYPVQLAGLGDDGKTWLQLAEDFVAINTVTYLSQYFVHLRNLVQFATVGLLLLLMTVSSYPFQPQHLLTIFVWTVIVVGLVGIVYVLVQMNRDELMSRISKTTPNKFTPDTDFFRGVATYAVPLLGVLAAQFPEVWDLIRSLLDPILRALK